MKAGDKVKLINTDGLMGYSFSKHIKKNKIYTVRKVKKTGGILLEEFVVGFSDERFGSGNEQGIMKTRFNVVNKNRKSKTKKTK